MKITTTPQIDRRYSPEQISYLATYMSEVAPQYGWRPDGPALYLDIGFDEDHNDACTAAIHIKDGEPAILLCTIDQGKRLCPVPVYVFDGQNRITSRPRSTTVNWTERQ